MAIQFDQLRLFLDGKESLLVSTHCRPDGDAIGSCFAMSELLLRLGKKPSVCFPTPPSSRYDFLLQKSHFSVFQINKPAAGKVDGVIILDTGTWNQLGDFGIWIKSRIFPICVIDHHETQDHLGTPVLVDTSAEATGRLVFEAYEEFKFTPCALSASALFVALGTDTGWFRHANTNSKTFSLCEKLSGLGANPSALYDSLYENNRVSRQKLTGLMLTRTQFRPNGKLVYSWLTQNDIDTVGADPADTEDIIALLRSTQGAEIVVFFLETGENSTRINFRSRSGTDVCKYATHLGGGGHKLAAGASVDLALPKAMEKVFSLIENYPPASNQTLKAASP